MILAEFQVGQVLWSMFWFFLFLMWVMLVISIFGDILRSDDLPGPMKAIWTVAIIVLPYLGVFTYLIIRGGQMGERNIQRANDREDAFSSYVRKVSGGGSAAKLAELAGLHDDGTLSDEEFAAAKSKIIG